MPPKLGILAGGGPLPGHVVAVCKAQKRDYFILAVKGLTDPSIVKGEPHAWTRLGAGGRHMKLLKEAGVEELVLIGPAKRPTLAAFRPDAYTLKAMARVGYKATLGDDGILRLVMGVFEDEGFRFVGADTILTDLLAGAGVMGEVQPDDEDRDDIRRGVEVVQGLGNLDVGQAAVIQRGIVLGVEASEGTDGLIARTGPLRRDGGGGVLVKLTKPQQDRRADLPTIGTATVEGVAKAGHVGIAFEAGATLVVDPVRVASRADKLGVFVVGIDPGNREEP